MPRVGLSPERVVDAAVRIVDAEGPAALTIARLASELGVRAPSLYNHVGGLDDVHRELGLRGADLIAEACGAAAMGRSGPGALAAVAAAYRRVALRHPGVYAFAQVARPGDETWDRRSRAALEPVLAVLDGYGIAGEDAVHAARTLRAALHGFVALETGGGFGLEEDPEDSFRYLVEVLDAGLSAHPRSP